MDVYGVKENDEKTMNQKLKNEGVQHNDDHGGNTYGDVVSVYYTSWMLGLLK